MSPTALAEANEVLADARSGPAAATQVNPHGLPVRVPMAHLPAVAEPATPGVPGPRAEPDPDAVGGMLSRFYGGVRRAEEEETTEISMSSYGGGEEESK